MKIIDDLPKELRGPTQNKYGGYRTQKYLTYGGKNGPASECRTLSKLEQKIIEDDLRARGELDPCSIRAEKIQAINNSKKKRDKQIKKLKDQTINSNM